MEGNELIARLSQIATGDWRELDRVCTDVAHLLLDAGQEPPFDVRSADFAADPYLICADRYWRLRFLRQPSVRTAAACAAWIHSRLREAEDGAGHAHRAQVEQSWALGYAVITRDSMESAAEIAQARAELGGSADIASFAALYHAGKLRASMRFDDLHHFLESSPLVLAAGPHRAAPVFTALRAFAAFGSRRLTTEYATDLLDHAWYSEPRSMPTTEVCLDALAAAVPFDGQGQLLRDRAGEAATEWPQNHLFVFRLACGLSLCGEHDAALEAMDLALALLPAQRELRDLRELHEQYLAKREAIEEARQLAEQRSVIEQQWTERARSYRRARVRMRLATTPLICLAIVAAAAIALISDLLLPQASGSDALPVSERMGLLLGQGAALLGFSATLLVGSWQLLRYRGRAQGRAGNADPTGGRAPGSGVERSREEGGRNAGVPAVKG